MTSPQDDSRCNRLDIVEDLPALRDLEADWKRLSESAPDAHVATLFPLVYANARRKDQEGPWRCYTSRADDGVLRIGLFGRRARSAIKRVAVPAFVVGTEYVSSFALAPDASAAELRPLLETLIQDNLDRTIIEFSRVSAAELHLLREAASVAGAMHTWTTDITGYYFDTRIPFKELSARFGSRLWRNLRRERTRLARRHAMRVETLESSCVEQNLVYLKRYMDMEAAGWKGRNNSDIRSIDSEYYRCIVERGAQDALIRWHSLLADETPIAMYLCIRHHATIWAPKTTYDEGFAPYSPGGELLLRMIEQSCDDSSVERLHMISNAPWVTRWRPSEEQYYRFRVYQPSVLGRSLFVAERARESLRSTRD
jgi:CelD/BcsL family acetyltransferase involved in cellulose biosynthesis